MLRLLVLLAVLPSLVLTACSGDESSSETQPNYTSPPDASATPQLPPSASGIPPFPAPPVGTTCEAEIPPGNSARANGADVGVGTDPFCIAWTDIFSNETGFRIQLYYGPDPIIYNVPANTNEVYPPPEHWPPGGAIDHIQVIVYVITPSGEEIVEGFTYDVN